MNSLDNYSIHETLKNLKVMDTKPRKASFLLSLPPTLKKLVSDIHSPRSRLLLSSMYTVLIVIITTPRMSSFCWVI